MLNYWQSPQNPKLERMYVSAKGFKRLPEIDSKAVKLWIEPLRSASGVTDWIIKAKGDATALGQGVMLQKRVIEAIGINPGLSWSELVAQFGSASGKPKPYPGSTAKRPRASATHTPPAVNRGSRAHEAAQLDIPSIKMVSPVTVQVDHREPKELINLMKSHPMVTVEVLSLDLGDIAVEDASGNRLLIERKRCDDTLPKSDFEVSVQDGRLFDQSERLKMEASVSDLQIIPIVLLEGDVYTNSTTMLVQAIDGALSFLSSIQRISVLPALHLNHSAYLILKLASHFVGGLYSPVTLHKSKPKVIWDQQRYALESLPGISTKVAELLLAEFGSVRKVMSASEDELLAIKGLGKRKVEALMSVLDGHPDTP